MEVLENRVFVDKIFHGTIPTVFLYSIYRSRPPTMLKYVKKCQKLSVVLACDAMGLSQPLCLPRLKMTLVSSFLRFGVNQW